MSSPTVLQGLGRAEHALLRRLSIFPGSFEPEAAVAVGADRKSPPTSREHVLPLLTRLRDRSLLLVETAALDGTRYRLAAALRSFASEQLIAHGEEPAVRNRHARHFERVSETLGPYGGPGHTAALARFDLEHDNLTAALAWDLGGGQKPEAALALATSLWWCWWVRGLTDEGRDWLHKCLDAVSSEPSEPRGRGLRAAAALARQAGDNAAARALGEQCLDVYRRLGDTYGCAAALNSLCITAAAQGDLDAATRFGLESVRAARDVGDGRGIATSLTNFGASLRALGRLDDAERTLCEAVDGFREIGDRRGEAGALSNLSAVSRRQGDHARARSRALASLSIYRELGLSAGALDTVEAIANLELAEGHDEVALRLLAVVHWERERSQLGPPVLPPDARAEHAAARAALSGEQHDRIVEQARTASFDAIVAELLEPYAH